jgi:hypothetical protein
MTTRFEDLSTLVDGVRDTFTTALSYQAGTLVLGYNGSVFPPGVNIKLATPPNTFQLTFTPPADTTALMIIYDDGLNVGGGGGGDPTGSEDMVASGLPPRAP